MGYSRASSVSQKIRESMIFRWFCSMLCEDEDNQEVRADRKSHREPRIVRRAHFGVEHCVG